MQFLEETEINNPNALATVFQELKNRRGLVPMTRDQSNYSITIMMADEDAVNRMYDDLNSQFPFNAFFARCGIFPIKYSKRLLIWLALIHFDANVGGLIFVGYYLQWYIHTDAQKSVMTKNELERGPLTLSLVCERVFPMGVLTKSLIHEFWDKQKVKAQPDNLVDHIGAAVSFMHLIPQES